MIRADPSRTSRRDPSRDAASLLRRLGFIVLFGGVPAAAMTGRSAMIALFMIGVLLVGSPALIAARARPRPERVREVVSSPGVLAGAVLALWTLASFAWTSSPRAAAALDLGVFAGVLLIGAAAFFALPERMRSANLYLVPIGATLAAAVAAGLLLSGRGAAADATPSGLGLGVLVVFAWPAIAWLRSRGRDGEALALALLIAGSAAFGRDLSAILALALGALAYPAVQLLGRPAAAAAGALAAACVVAAPLLLMLPAGGRASALGAGTWPGDVAAWRQVLLDQPARLLTGRGFDAAAALGLPTEGPFLPLLALWFDLGIVGAVAAATLAWAALRVALRVPSLLPGLTAAYVTAFSLSILGFGGIAPAWSAAIVTALLAFVAIHRGQARTRRPRMGASRRKAGG